MERYDSIRRKWEDYRPSKTAAFWFAALCVAAALIIGFGPAGWVTGATAEQRVNDTTLAARQELAAAICVEEFMATNDAQARLAKLRDAGYWERSELVATGGWAMCAAQLSEVKS